MWAIFVWTVLPAGGLLAAMLASGSSVAMSTASKVLSTPVRIGGFQLSLAVFMSAICGCLVAISYSGMRRHEVRMHAAEGTALAQVTRDQNEKTYFIWGRNYYLTLLGLTLWMIAWRLKALYDVQQLSPIKAGARPVSQAARLFYIVLGAVAFLAADVPLCRINYHLQLALTVTPQKERLEVTAANCENMFLETAKGPCADFCQNVAHLSKERLATINFARNWHVFGSLAARLFDDARGVEQGDARIQELFRRKSCAQVLKSVDKSNQMVNWMCMVCAVVAIMGAFSALSNAYEGSWYGNWNGADWYDMTHTDKTD